VAGDVLGCDEGRDEKDAEGNSDGREPAVTRAVLAGGLCVAVCRAGFVQFTAPVRFDAESDRNVTLGFAMGLAFSSWLPAKEEADPCGMTARKAKATAKDKANARAVSGDWVGMRKWG